jgi:hypothetical protein
MSDLTEDEREAIEHMLDGTADAEDWETIRGIEPEEPEPLTQEEIDVLDEYGVGH